MARYAIPLVHKDMGLFQTIIHVWLAAYIVLFVLKHQPTVQAVKLLAAINHI